MKQPPGSSAPHVSIAQLRRRAAGGLPGALGIEISAVATGTLTATMTLTESHLATNGYLHAGAVVTLADTSCGFGCISHLPDGATNFTTIELKSNFLRTTTRGTIRSEAKLVHAGRRTQVWDATVTDEEGRTLALFRCTQMLIY
ncbi:MAG: PaaI family thioesterase [Caldilineaceae bacterium]|nr:PaaI family thioesterase [Caldilineaceae bacterium]